MNNDATFAQPISMKKYIAIGVVAALVLAMVFSTIFEMLEVKATTPAHLAATFVGSVFSAFLFFKDHGRASTKVENGIYALYFLIGLFLTSAVLAAGWFYLLAPPESVQMMRMMVGHLGGQFLYILMIALLILFCIHYLAARWSFSWFTRSSLRAKEMKDAKAGQRL